MLEELLNQIRNAIGRHDEERGGRMDRDSLIGQIERLFNSHGDRDSRVLPASQDPYGDPADAGYGRGRYAASRRDYDDVLPASQDPLGDPADDDILPASQDPLGDPADARRRW